MPITGSFPCPISVTIDDDTLDQAPVFYGRVIKGVKNGPSPDWLQQQLKAIGLRPTVFWSMSQIGSPMTATARCTCLMLIKSLQCPARLSRQRRRNPDGTG